MTARCPLCGQLQMIRTADALVAALRLPVPKVAFETLTARQTKSGYMPHRSVYAGQSGRYHLTYGHHLPDVERRAIDDALASGAIVPEWPDTAHECWKLA